ncbi:T9SS type A sorting domain-containing protein [Hymenobacter sp. DH14]|uniref:T9SS type A sorting domain-containing protein n=1 Tax=Hymenobacter cyanobacteriorum TaxID=2926463 RepID=A0A9X1VHK5_9BACT|nr:T9SS type A sorting domain-containing protein [Hymenobacter cyanobacteriorum]MCI1188417.1 T9SS type A sorting domain-containing protein [Hymenobacter cyanobacteriorum]
MKKILLLVVASALASVAAHAQTPASATPAPTAATPAAPAKEEAILPNGAVAPAPIAAAPADAASTSKIAPAPETPAANPNAIKVKAEAVGGKLTVKTDNPGPTRVEVSDGGGRPVLTYTMMNGQTPAVLNVGQLPAGTYIVRCTAYEKTGMRRVMIGQ